MEEGKHWKLLWCLLPPAFKHGMSLRNIHIGGVRLPNEMQRAAGEICLQPPTVVPAAASQHGPTAPTGPQSLLVKNGTRPWCYELRSCCLKLAGLMYQSNPNGFCIFSVHLSLNFPPLHLWHPLPLHVLWFSHSVLSALHLKTTFPSCTPEHPCFPALCSPQPPVVLGWPFCLCCFLTLFSSCPWFLSSFRFPLMFPGAFSSSFLPNWARYSIGRCSPEAAGLFWRAVLAQTPTQAPVASPTALLAGMNPALHPGSCVPPIVKSQENEGAL